MLLRTLAHFFLASAAILVQTAAAYSLPLAAAMAHRRVGNRRSSAPRMELAGISLKRPLGIVFEECEIGKPRGLRVASLNPNGNAAKDGRIKVGDTLLAVSAVFFQKSDTLTGQSVYNKWSREMISATELDFDTAMKAIESNSQRHGYFDVVLRVRTGTFGASTTKQAANI